MGKYASDAHVLGTCVKYCTNASPLGEDGTYEWRPNITGSAVVGGFNNYYGGTDCFNVTAPVSLYSTANESGIVTLKENHISMDASRSNAVYTANGHVYPLSLALNFIIKS